MSDEMIQPGPDNLPTPGAIQAARNLMGLGPEVSDERVVELAESIVQAEAQPGGMQWAEAVSLLRGVLGPDETEIPSE